MYWTVFASPKINSTWSCCKILLMCPWIWFSSILLSIFASILAYIFLVVSLSDFGIRVMLALLNKFVSVPKLFGRVWEELAFILLKCLVEFTSKAIRSWTFLCWDFFLLIDLFTSNDWSFQIIYFFLIQFCWAVCF